MTPQAIPGCEVNACEENVLPRLANYSSSSPHVTRQNEKTIKLTRPRRISFRGKKREQKKTKRTRPPVARNSSSRKPEPYAARESLGRKKSDERYVPSKMMTRMISFILDERSSKRKENKRKGFPPQSRLEKEGRSSSPWQLSSTDLIAIPVLRPRGCRR